jgi:DNA-binding NtrC family response regulator
MPIASPSYYGESDFPLWSGVPDGWLRRHGRTRVLVIDDQLTKRQDLFAVASEKAALSPEEEQLRDWMNVDVQFFVPPPDYHYGGMDAVPKGTFDTAWFERSLSEALQDPRPIAAVLLDLLYGSEARIKDASGPKFLALLRRRLPNTPVLILSNIEQTSDVRGMVKEGGGTGNGDVSFQDYVPKGISHGRGLLERLNERLIAWADVSDPSLCAFSPAMRRLARQMRRIVLLRELIGYQEQNAKFPKPVVIKGNVGSGKNYIARRLHAISNRRNGPCLTADFSGHESQHFTTTLFGAGQFSGAVQWYRVRPTDAAVLGVTTKPAVNGLYLATLGLLHRAHIAEQPPGPNQTPLLGTLVIDEIGTAPEDMQERLLGVFNRGRFIPPLTGGEEIPKSGAIDVWFLVTLSPEGQQKLREDLATRLGSGHQLMVPSLRERREDVFPLALQELGASSSDEPRRFFTEEALDELTNLSDAMQVRELTNLIKRLSGITEMLPYSGAELRESAGKRSLTTPSPDVTGELRSQRSYSSDKEQLETASSALAPPKNALPVLLAWCKARTAQFSADLREQDQLRGKGRQVVGGAAIATLSFLELCVEATSNAGRYSATRTWNFFAGVQGTKAPDARTQIAPLFLIDDDVSLDMLRRSNALLWLALDVSPRRKEVKELVDRIQSEEGQAARIDKMRSTGEESD